MRRIVKFEKNDCNPCAMVSDLLDKKGVEYERVNPFDNPDMAVKYRVRRRTIGFKPEEINEIISMI